MNYLSFMDQEKVSLDPLLQEPIGRLSLQGHHQSIFSLDSGHKLFIQIAFQQSDKALKSLVLNDILTGNVQLKVGGREDSVKTGILSQFNLLRVGDTVDDKAKLIAGFVGGPDMP